MSHPVDEADIKSAIETALWEFKSGLSLEGRLIDDRTVEIKLLAKHGMAHQVITSCEIKIRP